MDFCPFSSGVPTVMMKTAEMWPVGMVSEKVSEPIGDSRGEALVQARLHEGRARLLETAQDVLRSFHPMDPKPNVGHCDREREPDITQADNAHVPIRMADWYPHLFNPV